MKTPDLSQIYKHLTNQQKASLALSLLAKGDDQEFKKLDASVQWRVYYGKDSEYVQTFNQMRQIAGYWSMLHWKWQAFRHNFASVYFCKQAKDIEDKEALKEWISCESKLITLELVLEYLAYTYGIDLKVTRTMAGTEPFEASFDGVVSDLSYFAAVCDSI